MAKTQSKSSPFPSRWGGGFISGAQLISEIICERIAKIKKRNLFDKFWDKPEWQRTFLLQIRLANGLLKLYDVEAVLRALRGDGKNVYSLSAPWLDGIIKFEQAKLDRQKQQLNTVNTDKAEEVCTDTVPAPIQQFVAEKSKMSKLKDL